MGAMDPNARVGFRPVTTRLEQARTWALGSDPGLLRLQLATRTILALGVALLVLGVLTKATGQPLTVALLGAIVAMVSARGVSDPDPRRQRVTLALLPLPAAASIATATVLAPHRVAADVAFVLILFVAVYIRRFGSRGKSLGMVAVMSYFFSLFLRAGVAELPWLIVAVAVGTLCSFVMTTYVLPERPDRLLLHTVRSLRARMAIVVDAAADVVRSDRVDERRRRRLRIRVARLNETALMVQSQLEDNVDPSTVWPGVDGTDLALRLFDAELTIERVAVTAERVADAEATVRGQLAAALRELAAEMRAPGFGGLARAGEAAAMLVDGTGIEVRRVAMAIIDTTAVMAAIRALPEHGAEGPQGVVATPEPESGPEPDTGLRPTTRQAIQVAVAGSLAIVIGELVSPDRWYWAVIAAFVTFAGTASFGETLTKGWQRLVGTVLGVPAGVLVATALSGDAAVSLVSIFVCLFCAFYVMKVSYGLMIFWITTTLALLYGLTGQFSVDLLLLRIEETAIGSVIGVTVALLVLPARTGTAIRRDAHAFLTTLSVVVDAAVQQLVGAAGAVSATEQARGLHRQLQQFRETAKPVTVGIAGLAGRTSLRRGLRLLKACDHYARTLARSSEGPPALTPELADAFTAAAALNRSNVDALVAILDQREALDMRPVTDLLDTVDRRGQDRAVLAASHALRQIDRAVVDAAVDLGAGEIRLW